MRIRTPFLVLLTAGTVAATAAAPVGAAVGPAPAATTTTCCNALQDVDVLSPTYAWAVGSAGDGRRTTSLAMHWNGAAWRAFATPLVGTGSELMAVAALSPTSAWAVGTYRTSGGVQRTLVLRWNGSSWRVFPSPNVGATSNVLHDIAVVGPTSIWAVGQAGERTLVLRWNGSAWRAVATPLVGSGSQALHGVAALSATQAWAVGQRYAGGRAVTLAMRWNGTAWKAVSTPNAGAGSNFLFGGVAAVSPTDVWAVGSYAAGSRWRTLALRWNGSAWRVVATPDPGTSSNHLYGGVSAAAGNAVWAVGGASNGSGYRSLVLRWNGGSWAVSPAPIPSGSSELGGVDALTSRLVVAVGWVAPSTTLSRTLRLRWNGTVWRGI